MILERFKMGGSAGQSLISYARPETSPLLQLGLPRDDSASPHPEVDGWRPVFRSRDDRRFLQAVEWLRSMHRPRPEIPIQYEPPTWADIEKARDSSEPQADEPGEQEPAPDR